MLAGDVPVFRPDSYMEMDILCGQRRTLMKWLYVISVVVAVAVVFLLSGIQTRPVVVSGGSAPAQLVVYCAAGIRSAVDPVAREYEKKYGTQIIIQYGGSGTLLNNMKITKTGDLFVPADQSYVAIAREQGLIAETIPLARQTPVIAVRRGNPKKIASLADMKREDVKLSLANPDAASIGSVTKKLLQKSGEWSAIEARVRENGVFKPTVNDIANDIKIGSVDAGIVWDSTAMQYPELEAVRAPELDGGTQEAGVCVLNSTRQSAAALRFARYLSAKDKGLQEFARHHYQTVDGDEWAEAPELKVFSGAMLRPAIEKTLKDFEAREGVRITTVYNGCGILTAQMKAGEKPDAYFSCDVSFMDSVSNMYVNPVTVSVNEVVMLVARGNPQGIKKPEDLKKPGLKVGLAHPEKSALGVQTKRFLADLGIYDEVQKNQKLDAATGDFLVNQIRTGSLDAVLVWRSNAAGVKEFLDVVSIEHPLASAKQPYGVGKDSRYRHLMQRLQDALLSAESKQRFESAGLTWSVPARGSR
ncbi:MAG: molybdate ABC transporter substrate-binding protein [Verrucomicrobia bacterium]|nr:molybdate ABC transporter substrate-binding protein [Verrucomicrobiota bacterium]